MMKRLIQATGLLLALGFSAHAHSPLQATIPAESAVLAEMPAEVKLTFAKPARLTKVVLIRSQGSDPTEERLEIADKGFAREMDLSHSLTGEGAYTVQWRALSEDGHALKGSFSFQIKPE